MELKTTCLAGARRYEVEDLLRGIIDLDGQGDPVQSRTWQENVSLVDITRVLAGGRSDAVVYDITVLRSGRPAQRQVLKVGRLAEIAAEWSAYRSWLTGSSSANLTPVTAVSRAVRQPSGPERLGAIVYRHVAAYAGRSSMPVITLEESVRGAIEGSIPLDDTLAILRALIEQLDETVWHARPDSPRHTLVSLNELLGPDLVLEVDRAADADTLTFQDPSDEQRRDKVRYSGTVLEQASVVAPTRRGPEAIQLDATIELRDVSTSAGTNGHLLGHFGDTTVEIRRAEGADPHFQLLDYADHPVLTVVGRVVALRGHSWWSKIGHAVATADRNGDAIVIDDVPVGDPFVALPNQLTDFVSQRVMTVVHGDLNPRNILLVDRQIFLIDFANARVGPPLSDVAWLEVCLLRDVVASVLDWPALVELQRVLAVWTRVADAVTALPAFHRHHDVVGRVAAILWEIRAGAQRCHQLRGTNHPWWREYQDHLLISGLRTLKWDDQAPSQIYATMAAAGVAAEQLESRPYRYWQADETFAAANAVFPVLDGERQESLDIAAEFVSVVDRSGVADERLESLESALAAWRGAYLAAHHIETAAVVLGELADDHDLYISLQAFIRLKGQLQSSDFAYRAGSRFAEDPLDYWVRSDPFDYRPRRDPFAYPIPPDPFGSNNLSSESDEADTERSEEEARPAFARPAWAVTEIRDPDAIDLVLGEWTVVVLGDAGSGKSTVARELQYQLARAVMSAAGREPSQDVSETPDFRRSIPQLLPVTLRAPLVYRTLDAATGDPDVADDAKSFDHILQDCLTEPIPVELLRVGAVHMTIDAFNEVDTAGRKRVAAWIHWLRRTYARVPIVICHRRNGFSSEELPFPVVMLQSVSVVQARDYIRTTLRLRKLPDHEERAATLIRLLLDRPANPTIRDFARVPLYLWMITTRYAQHGVVPKNVGDLFAGFSQWYLTGRDANDRASRQFSYEEQVRGLEIIARHLVETGNVTDITVTDAVLLITQAGLTRPGDLIDDLVRRDMLDRDGAQMRFHHQSFQEYFAALVLYREVGDLTTFRGHVLEFRWREPLQMMLSFSSGEPTLARQLINIALKADPRFAASLLRWTENPPEEALDGFLAAQRQALATATLGAFEWTRAAQALVELGTEAARAALVESLIEPRLPAEARSAVLSALLGMNASNRFEDMRDILSGDIARAVTTVLQSSAPTPLRAEAAAAVGDAELMPLAAYLVALIDTDEPWQVVRAAWNSLIRLKQVLSPAMERRYVSMCTDRLIACRAELAVHLDRDSIQGLQDERLELLEVLSAAGKIRPVLEHRFAYGLSDAYEWEDMLAPENYPEITGQALGRILAGESSVEELIATFRGDRDREVVAAAAHMICLSAESTVIERFTASVDSTSSPIQLLAAAAVARDHTDVSFTLPIIRDLIGLLPNEHYLEATVALLSNLSHDEIEHVRLRIRARRVLHFFDEEIVDRVSSRWPPIDLWYQQRHVDGDLISELMLSENDEDLQLAAYFLGSFSFLKDGRVPPDPLLTEEGARERLLSYLTSVFSIEISDDWRGDRNIFVACAVERLVDAIPLAITASSQPGFFTTEKVSADAEYGTEKIIGGCTTLAAIGLLGRIAHEEGERALADRAHSFLVALSPQKHHSMERSRLLGLAILGDFVGLLLGLRSGDRRMLTAAKNAIEVWLKDAPYAPVWATNYEAVGIWVRDRLADNDVTLAPDVRSTLGEIKDWIERQLGRNIGPHNE